MLIGRMVADKTNDENGGGQHGWWRVRRMVEDRTKMVEDSTDDGRQVTGGMVGNRDKDFWYMHVET